MPRSWRPTRKTLPPGGEAGLTEAMLDRLLLQPGAPCRHSGGCAQGDHPGRSGRGRNRQPGAGEWPAPLPSPGAHRGHRRHLRGAPQCHHRHRQPLPQDRQRQHSARWSRDLPLQPGVGAGDPACPGGVRPARGGGAVHRQPGQGAGGRVAAPRPLRGHDHPPRRCGSSQDVQGEQLHPRHHRRVRYQPYLRGRERRSGAFPGGHRERQGAAPLRLQCPRYPAGTREGGGHLAAATGGSDERAQGDSGGRAQRHGAAGWQRQPVRRGAGRFRHRVAAG